MKRRSGRKLLVGHAAVPALRFARTPAAARHPPKGAEMKNAAIVRSLSGFVPFGACLVTGLVAQTPSDSAQRVEQKRSNLTGAPEIEVIASISECKPGEGIDLHLPVLNSNRAAACCTNSASGHASMFEGITTRSHSRSAKTWALAATAATAFSEHPDDALLRGTLRAC